MRRILIIINPVAGKGKSINLLQSIKEKLGYLEDIEIKIIISAYKGNIQEIVQENFEEGFREFIAVGGDGTLSELINGIKYRANDKCKIAIIPTGTGNDFIRNFEREYTFDAIISRVIRNEYYSVDVGCVNDWYFINTCTFGIDGPIVKDTEKFKNIIPGSPAYFLSTIKNALTFKSNRVRIEIDGRVIEDEYLLIAIGNGKYIGGGMKICPDAFPNDGMLEICLVQSVSKFKFAKEFAKIYEGRLKEIDQVSYQNGNTIEITNFGVPYYVNADGNIVGQTPAKIELFESALFFT